MATIYLSLSTKIVVNKQEILIRFSHGKINQRAKTNIFIPAEYWDKDTENIIVPNFRLMNDEKKELKQYLTDQVEKLNALIAYINTAFNALDKSTITPDWLTTTVDIFNFPEKYAPKIEQPVEISFFDAFDDFLIKHPLSEGRKKNIRVVFRCLKRFELFVQQSDCNRKSWKWELDSVIPDTFREFSDFLKNEHIYFDTMPELYEAFPEYRKQKPRGQNTLNDILKKLRTFFIWCNKTAKITTNRPFDDFKIEECVYGTPFYITIEERNKLYNLDLSHRPALEKQRDIFVFQCLIGCRVGDFYKLTKQNIINEAVEYIAGKTKDEKPITVRVPLSAIAKEILAKYSDFEGKALFPLISEQKYNDAIKVVFELAEITRNVVLCDPLTRENVIRPINEVASSHLARRCFVGNMYKKAKDQNLVAELSGHKPNSRAFARYRTIDEEMRKELISMIE